MGGLTNKGATKQPTIASSIQFQTSARGGVIPLVYGTARVSPNVLDYDDFRSHQVSLPTPGGGKGGVGSVFSKGGSSSTVYTASFILGVCQGPITNFGQAFINKSITTVAGLPQLSSINLGADGQAIDPYWVSTHGDKAINYSGLANVVLVNYQLGNSPTIPAFSFEALAILANSGINGMDADPSQIVTDFLTNPRYGANFPSSNLADIINGSYGAYVRALGLFLSYAMETQQDANVYLSTIAKLTNSAIVWSSGLLKFLPYGDQPINGAVSMNSAWTIQFQGPGSNATTTNPFTVSVIFQDPNILGGVPVTVSRTGTDVAGVAQTLTAEIASLVSGPFDIIVTLVDIAQTPVDPLNPNQIALDICHISLIQQPPLGTTTVTGGITDTATTILAGTTGGTGSYIPITQAIYSLNEDDYIVQETSVGAMLGPNPGGDALRTGGTPITGGFSDDPVHITRSSPADAANVIQLEVLDRTNWYNSTTVEVYDQSAIDLYGYRIDKSSDARAIADPGYVGYIVAQLLLQRAQMYRNTYTFKLGWKYILLEPMDLVQITDSRLGVAALTVRITGVEEDDEGTLTVTAEDFFGAYNSSVMYPKPDALLSGTPTVLGVGGGTSVTIAPQLGTGSTVQNSNQQPGDVNAPVIFEPPSGVLSSGLQVWIALSGASPSWGGAQVWISSDGSSYTQLGQITGDSVMGLTTVDLPTYNGPAPDVSNVLSVNLAESGGTLISVSLSDASNLVSLCYVGGEFLAYQTATLVSAESYNLTTLYRGAHGTTIGDHPIGTSFVFITPQVGRFSFPTTMIGRTIYLKFLSFNQMFSNIQNIAFVTAYSYTITGAGLGMLQTAVPAGFAAGKPASGATVQSYVFTIPTTLPAGLIGSQGAAGTGAASTATFSILKNGSPIGTMTFASSATTATFAMTSSTTFNVGDVLTVTAPNPQDGTLADISWTFVGTQTA